MVASHLIHSNRENPLMTFKTLPVLGLFSILTPSLSPCFPITHFALDTLTSLLSPSTHQACPYFLLLLVFFPNYLYVLASHFLCLSSQVTFSGRTTLPTQSKILTPSTLLSPFFASFFLGHLCCYFLISLIKNKLLKSRIFWSFFVHVYNPSIQDSA